MTNPTTGFLAGEIQRDYMGAILDFEDAVGLDLKGQPKKKKDDVSAGGANCTCDTTNCHNTCVTLTPTQAVNCKPPKGPKKRASW